MASPQSPNTLSTLPPTERFTFGWQRWLWSYGPPLLLMLLMFMASTDLGSSAHSGRIIGRLLTWLGLAQRMTPNQLDLVNHYIRKLGHVMEYALLAGLLHRALAATHPTRTRWAPQLVLLALGRAGP